jgi:hypothetical protein
LALISTCLSTTLKTRGNILQSCLSMTYEDGIITANCQSGQQQNSRQWLPTQIDIAQVFANYPKKSELGVDNQKTSEGCRLEGSILNCAKSNCTKNTRYTVNLDDLVENKDGKLTAVSSKGNFSKTCRDITYSKNILSATCQTSGKQNNIKQSNVITLDINQCIANIESILTWQKNGNFKASCHNCELEFDHNIKSTFHCWCLRSNNNQHYSPNTLNLNESISFVDGKLQCDVAKKFLK